MWTLEQYNMIVTLIAEQDHAALDDYLAGSMTERDLLEAILVGSPDEAKVACVCLTTLGTAAAEPVLDQLLSRANPALSRVAEHALAGVWLRTGPDEDANERLHDAVVEDDAREALIKLHELIAEYPDWAELYYQRGLRLAMLDHTSEALSAFLAATNAKPGHWAAWLNAGHCYLLLSKNADALECYRRVQHLHPLAEDVDELVRELTAGQHETV